jgi:hypothetical protein
MNALLTGFIYAWSALALCFIMLLNFFTLTGEPTLWAGVEKLQAIWSPFNIVNYAAVVITLSPALGAYWWREKRRTGARRVV